VVIVAVEVGAAVVSDGGVEVDEGVEVFAVVGTLDTSQLSVVRVSSRLPPVALTALQMKRSLKT
jgi:hypothetical protein